MKNSSRQKNTPPPPQNRLNKTQLQPKPAETLENTYYGQKGKINQIGKPTTPQQFPPRAGSTQKINYKIEENMTHSKINEAKQGLLLLKKKMSRNMSRQKNVSGEKKEESYDQPVSKKTIYKSMQQQQEYAVVKQKERPIAKVTEKGPMREQVVRKTPPISSKTIQEKPIKRQPVNAKNDIANSIDEAPIKSSNQDFMAILERQMAKESGNLPKQKPIAKKPTAYDQEQGGPVELIQCSKGCGRQFNINALPKHQKICEKVFLTKRKAFDSANFRAPEVQDFKKPPSPPPLAMTKTNQKKGSAAQKQQKIPKWKQQSAQFRASLKNGRGAPLTAEQKAITQNNGLVPCPCCGRKFNDTAAKRHIPVCQAKSKQMPRMNTTKKK